MIKTGANLSVAVVLSGCGGWDGTEIHEAVLTLLALERAGVSIVCTAPDMNQLHVLNHLSSEEMDQNRNAMVESARLVHREVLNLNSISARDLDAVILPGGQGVIKQLSDFAVKGPQGRVNAGLQDLLQGMHRAGKPIGAISIAPIIVVQALGAAACPEVTIGRDKGTACAIERMGGRHLPCRAHEIHHDRINHIVSTPGCSTGADLTHVATGIDNMVLAILTMLAKP